MENYTITLLIMALMIGASAFSDKIKLPVPVILILVGIAAGIAALAHFLIPGMSWPLAFVLGAILSATDAVAASRNNGGKSRISQDALFDSRTSLIITWSGMRGIVSLAIAIAIALPVTLGDGKPFPMHNEIVFLSIAVVLFSLLGQGLTLPLVVRKFGRKLPKENPQP